jgi:hypothetical protein
MDHLLTDTADLLSAAMKRQRANGYRQAAAALLELAEEEEREARQAGEVMRLIAEADAALVRRPRGRIDARY